MYTAEIRSLKAKVDQTSYPVGRQEPGATYREDDLTWDDAREWIAEQMGIKPPGPYIAIVINNDCVDGLWLFTVAAPIPAQVSGGVSL